ncbi:elongin-B-like [Haliotis rufescens]|uniref:elongin-B-like n=1 Tax=Haliotis rufescens TaxID=6454 RepID=UPI001EAFA06F|nr:elongin-B-like [Haliotis rufescens]
MPQDDNRMVSVHYGQYHQLPKETKRDFTGLNEIVSVCCWCPDRESIMDVFLMIRRKKVTIFTDAKETTSLGEVKKIIEGICKVCPENQKLFKDDQPLTDDHKTLGDYGFTGATARAQAPATLGLAFRQDDGEWEGLEISSYSSPPELPDVMKPQDSSSSHAQEQPAS